MAAKPVDPSKRPQIPLRFDDADLHAAFVRYTDDTRQTMTGCILNLIESLLRDKGYYPPKGESAD